MQQYTPGLHILSSFKAEQHDLCAMHECREYLNSLIVCLGLTKVGEAWHLFDNGGFTAVIALTESHVSLHTWPEYGMATFDVFLSNYRRDNGDRARSFYRETISFFKGQELDCRELTR